MKILNIRLKNIFIITISLLILFLIMFLLISSQHLLNSRELVMTEENFIEILKEVHNFPYKYDGYKIKMSGYIFRKDDFKENQFVVARNMEITENDVRIVGFLCEYKNAEELKNNEWIECEGTIYIGDYYGIMPIVKIQRKR